MRYIVIGEREESEFGHVLFNDHAQHYTDTIVEAAENYWGEKEMDDGSMVRFLYNSYDRVVCYKAGTDPYGEPETYLLSEELVDILDGG